ncbi:MAG: hypothetical protein J6V20_01700 [Bacteroidaceae bacterium]|nr:hypothetical protein [Bacteroidaceae bacterium]
MRTLSFNVKNQIIEKDPMCDFSGLVAGTSGYIYAKFSFSADWDGCTKVVGFFSKDGREFEPCVLYEENTCQIPREALEQHEFKIQVFGKKNGCFITTRPISVKQYGGVQ